MRRRARGIVGLVVLSLGLGVVTTYGVAWWLMNRRVPRFGGLTLVVVNPPGSSCIGWDVSLQGVVGRVEAVSWPKDAECRGMSMNGYGLGTDVNGVLSLPKWSLLGDRSPNEVRELLTGQVPFAQMDERASGWPALAVVEHSCWGVAGNAIPVRRHDATLQFSWGLLAFMPMWPGFAVDVLVFGLGWSVVMVGPRWIRGRIRVRLSRAGRCATCRYDLSGLSGGVCPECGTAVKEM